VVVQEEFLGSFLGACKLSLEEASFGLALESAGNGFGELGWELSWIIGCSVVLGWVCGKSGQRSILIAKFGVKWGLGDSCCLRVRFFMSTPTD
jgi:hypothetical protein